MSAPVKLTPSEAADRVGARDTLAVPLGPGQPPGLLRALGERVDFAALTVFGALLVDAFPLFTKPGVRLVSGFFGPAERALVEAGHDVRFLPADFRRFAPALAKLAPRVMATAVAGDDERGPFSLSLHAGATVDALRDCGRDPNRVLIAELNPKLPRTLGLPPDHPHTLLAEDVDVVEVAEEDVLELPDPPPTAEHRRMSEHARAFIPVDATLQTGIGGIASAIVGSLAEGSGGAYGVHTEMFTDALMRLHESGQVANAKGLYDGVSITTFAAGSRNLYHWLDGNASVRFLPVDVTNDPSLIARNRAMTSINGALAIDLFGQVAADTIDGRPHSGIGGHEDFVAGAGLPTRGRSLVCLPSTTEVEGKRVSRLVARLDPGMLVTTPRHQLDVVVTEHGAADVAGLDVRARGEALLAIAHPDFREELARQWETLQQDRLGSRPAHSGVMAKKSARMRGRG